MVADDEDGDERDESSKAAAEGWHNGERKNVFVRDADVSRRTVQSRNAVAANRRPHALLTRHLYMYTILF